MMRRHLTFFLGDVGLQVFGLILKIVLFFFKASFYVLCNFTALHLRVGLVFLWGFVFALIV